MAEYWQIEWHDHQGQAISESAETVDEAVELLRHFLSCETFAESRPSATQAVLSAFDELFQGGDPAVLLRHTATVVQHECVNGRFVIKRIRRALVLKRECERLSPSLIGMLEFSA